MKEVKTKSDYILVENLKQETNLVPPKKEDAKKKLMQNTVLLAKKGQIKWVV